MSKIIREVAEVDFNKWLDFKKVKDNKRQDSKDQAEEIINAIMDGSVAIDDSMNIVQTLQFPIESESGEIVLEKLKYKPRISVQQLNIKLKGIKPGDGDGRVLAYASALTDQNSALIGKLDTEDARVMQSIVVFFL